MAAVMLMAVFVALFLAMSPHAAVLAASYAVTVTVTSDTDNACATTGAPPCSLRDAIRYTNSKAATDTTTITLPAGTYLLTHTGACEGAALSGDLDIRGNMILNGAGAANTVIDGMGSDRVFDIGMSGSPITASISGVTIQNGKASPACGSTGGGITMTGNVTLMNVVVADNAAVFAGGINDTGTLNLVNSTVRDNRACGPGGIGQSGGGILTLTRSTVSGNIATITPTGVSCPGVVTGYAGGIFSGSTILMTNSTVSGNNDTFAYADNAGGIRNGGPMTIAYSTIAANGVGSFSSSAGGIVNTTNAHTTIQGSIVAGNVGGQCLGTQTSLGYNIASDDSCALGQSSDLPHTDPQIGPLADNGGPTLTHMLALGSPAIDRVPVVGANCPATDQRGVVRPFGVACDIGAYEVKVNPMPRPAPTSPPLPPGAPTPAPLPRPRPTGVVISAATPLPIPPRH